MINFNDPAVRFVLAVIAAGVGILLITLIPYGIVVLLLLIAVVYYLLRRNNKI